ncbi:CHAT domain-containing protein [Oxynema sp. CENA135]|jgi:CHAT domain-containing protein|uniref:CHAT domain-containing protein n=1 Tax=Oxynema sp. CENA135 TaxID=984206 RepID=UPI00190B28D4|nr:CHAT domain-containing protein [Oxynema sp. CENA135]MBK4730435.1 CHAT domain-containing protein [Oxynema sp. CENA135]
MRSVPDDSTTILMREFDRNWQQSRDRAQALQTAMLTTQQKYPNPYAWAGFTLIGEAQ